MKIEIIFAFIIGFLISEIFGSQLLEPHILASNHGGDGCSHLDYKINKYSDCVKTGKGSGTKSHLAHTKVSGSSGKQDYDHPEKLKEYYIKDGTWYYQGADKNKKGADKNKTCTIYVGKSNNKVEYTCPRKGLSRVEANCGGLYSFDIYRSKFMAHDVGCHN